MPPPLCDLLLQGRTRMGQTILTLHPPPVVSNNICDVLCDVTADTDSQIWRCAPGCADVALLSVNTEGDQYL
jgi:hypothetical protein